VLSATRDLSLGSPPDDVFNVRLVRHGETTSYQSNSGLTARGRRQALEKGCCLAAEIPAGATVWLPHARTARAAETAKLLGDGLRGAGRLDVGTPYVDEAFDNFRVWCEGKALDPTDVYSAYRRVRDEVPIAERPGWHVEMERYLGIQEAGSDPIAYWLTTPLQHFEPPAAAVRRFWRGVCAAANRAPRGTHLVVSTHSGCLRALATAALGADLGEPLNAEDVTLRLRNPVGRAVVIYRGASVDIEVPAPIAPAWCGGHAVPAYPGADPD
jgi:broad specificity phosphatase PhoE